MARVLIISAFHERSDAVELTLTSIAEQAFDDWEAFVWDDASKDSTWEELVRVSRKLDDQRIQVFRHEQNIGFVEGMNFAIRRSDAEFVAVVGSGDFFDPHRIARQVNCLDENPRAPFCTTGSISIDVETGARFSDNSFGGSRISPKDLFHSCPFTHGSVMFRRDRLVEAGMYEPLFTWSSDWDLFNRMVKRDEAIHLPDQLYFRYARMDGASFSPEKSVLQVKFAHLVHMVREQEEARSDILSRVRQHGLDNVLETRKKRIAADLRSRQVKLYLLGKRAHADDLGARLDREFGRSMFWQSATGVFRLVSYLPAVKLYGLVHRMNAMRKSLRN